MAQNVFFTSPDARGDVKSDLKVATNGGRVEEEENETDEEELEKSLLSYEQFDNRWSLRFPYFLNFDFIF